MKKIAIANRKGGTGKTTAAVHLAAGLARAGKRVLLIDTDTQSQCALHLGVTPPEGLGALIRGEDPKNCLFKARERLDLLAGGPELAAVSKEISLRTMAVEYALSEALAPIEGDYDAVILDGAPGFSPLSVNMLVYSDWILSPVVLEALAIDGLVKFTLELRSITKRADTTFRYVLPRDDRRVKQSSVYLEQLHTHFDGMVLDAIPYDVRISEAASWGKTVYEHAGTSRGSLAYVDLVRRIHGEI